MKNHDNAGLIMAYIRFRQQELERIDKMLYKNKRILIRRRHGHN